MFILRMIATFWMPVFIFALFVTTTQAIFGITSGWVGVGTIWAVFILMMLIGMITLHTH